MNDNVHVNYQEVYVCSLVNVTLKAELMLFSFIYLTQKAKG